MRNTKQAVKPKSIVHRLIGELMKQKWTLLLVLLGAIVSAVLGILYPLLIARAIEEIIGESQHIWNGCPMLGVILVALTVLFLVRGGFGYIQEYVMSGVSQKLC